MKIGQKMETVVLRQWKGSDFEPYAEMNADVEVMRHFLEPISKQESAESFDRMRGAIEERGWGVWAVEVDGAFAGATGLQIPRAKLPFLPCTEILWRFRREFWGRSLAFAAATQALDHGFSKLGLAEIVTFTAVLNPRSIRLMERLGFSRDWTGDFDHPNVPPGHPLQRHVLYRKGC